MALRLNDTQVGLHASINHVSEQSVRDAEQELIKEVGGLGRYWLLTDDNRWKRLTEKLRAKP